MSSLDLVGLVQLAKQLGIPSRIAPLVAIAAGALWAAANVAHPSFSAYVHAAKSGLEVALAACGAYSTVSTLKGQKATPPTV